MKQVRHHDVTRKYWGHNVELDDRATTESVRIRVTGWLTPTPSEGDHIVLAMQSGRPACLHMDEIERLSNPHDMFFGYGHFQGYRDECGVKV